MKHNFIFDVDGTLTPSRGVINPNFNDWMVNFADCHPVYLVTGSDREKTLEQIGSELYNKCKKVYQCSGNDIWICNNNIETKAVNYPVEFDNLLNKILSESKYHRKTGRHIEYRPGLCNFSIVGRNATLEDRVLYRQWDEHKREREKIVFTLTEKYGSILDIKVAGETGVDIVLKGHDKSQILNDFDKSDQITFFGDSMDINGNDWPLANALENGNFLKGNAVQVKDWKHTWEILKAL